MNANNHTDIISAMFAAGVQYGHKCRFSNPAMQQYIHQIVNGSHIFDLRKTETHFLKALEFIGKIASQEKQILFVGTKSKAGNLIKKYAQVCHMPYVDRRWIGGTLTNYDIIRHSVKKLDQLMREQQEHDFAHMLKKERVRVLHNLNNLMKKVGGITTLKGMPSALFVIDARTEQHAIKEAKALNIPVIAIVDSNSSPQHVDYLIPGNDDSIKAIDFYLSHVSEMIRSYQSPNLNS